VLRLLGGAGLQLDLQAGIAERLRLPGALAVAADGELLGLQDLLQHGPRLARRGHRRDLRGRDPAQGGDHVDAGAQREGLLRPGGKDQPLVGRQVAARIALPYLAPCSVSTPSAPDVHHIPGR
jgi:hypothetical protein